MEGERGRCSRMDESRFEEIYRRYATDVLRFSYFYLGNREQAEDVTQDTFLRLLTASPDLKEGVEKPWLLKVALNRCKDLWRNSWAKRVIIGSPMLELIPDESSQMEDRQEKEALMQAVNRLPAKFREVILLYYYQQLSIPEISRVLNSTTGSISSRLARARQKLESILKGSDACEYEPETESSSSDS